jgi:hypothetical protein
LISCDPSNEKSVFNLTCWRGELEAADTVGAVVNASGIASKRDVAGQLADLVSGGESGAPPELPRGAIEFY